MEDESSEPLEPEPTYTIPVFLLVAACVLGGMELYEVVFNSKFVVEGLFIVPGAFLLGVLGLFDPRIPSSIRPGARGYPMHLRVIAHLC